MCVGTTLNAMRLRRADFIGETIAHNRGMSPWRVDLAMLGEGVFPIPVDRGRSTGSTARI